MATSAYPLGATERRLQQRVEAILGDGEIVRASVVAIQGPRPGLEALFAPVLGLLAWLCANARRQFTTIAVTDRGLVILDNAGLRRPVRVRERFDSLSVLGPMNDTIGDAWIEVNGVRYWIEGIWSSQLYEMRKLKRSSAEK